MARPRRRLLPYLDVPFQHASPRILKLMKRPANAENTLARDPRVARDLPGHHDPQHVHRRLPRRDRGRVRRAARVPRRGAARPRRLLRLLAGRRRRGQRAARSGAARGARRSRQARFMEAQARISAARLRARSARRSTCSSTRSTATSAIARSRGRRAGDRRRRAHRRRRRAARRRLRPRRRHRRGRARPRRPAGARARLTRTARRRSTNNGSCGKTPDGSAPDDRRRSHRANERFVRSSSQSHGTAHGHSSRSARSRAPAVVAGRCGVRRARRRLRPRGAEGAGQGAGRRDGPHRRAQGRADHRRLRRADAELAGRQHPGARVRLPRQARVRRGLAWSRPARCCSRWTRSRSRRRSTRRRRSMQRNQAALRGGEGEPRAHQAARAAERAVAEGPGRRAGPVRADGGRGRAVEGAARRRRSSTSRTRRSARRSTACRATRSSPTAPT